MSSLGLARLPGRCPRCEHHVATQGHGPECAPVAPTDEWSLFVTALATAAREGTRAREDGFLHQADVRPLIRGRVEPKHIGLLYRRARTEGLLRPVGHEPSDDEEGKNAGRMEPYYQWRGKAA